jgi:uncharacterized protein with NRDE domain
LILAWRVFGDAPVAAAANRDEATDRPSRPPGVLDDDPLVIAPQDEEAGGTWIGYNEHGVFVAITNRRTDLEGERSRGLLVRDALTRATAADALAHVRAELAERQYAGFNLVVADARDATLVEWDGVLRSTDLEPGIHIVVNAGLDDSDEKAAAIRDAAEGIDADDAREWLDEVVPVLRDHDLGACVHGDGFGTRSSSLLVVGADGRASYRFADGPPCETEYRPVSLPEGQV